MSDKLDVIYNDTCPICSREVDMYKGATDETVVYHGLSDAELTQFGLNDESAAREFHVRYKSEVLSGLPAFALLWDRMPRMRWLAWLVRLPVLGPVLNAIYKGVLAPVLFWMHRRRQARLQ